MGADWYYCFTLFGYEIKLPSGITYPKFVNELMKINEFLQEPFKITGILSSFHSRMEGSSFEELSELDDGAIIIIGFKPPSNLEYLTHLINELKDYVTDNHYLMGLEISETPEFYSGIKWFERYYDYESSDEEDDEDDEDDDDEEDEEDEEDKENDDEEEDDNDDGASSDEDETKIAPEPFKSKSE